MLKVHDGRKTNEIRLYEIECGDFFTWKDLVFRRVIYDSIDGTIVLDDDDAILTMLMTTGELHAINRSEWVEPIPNNQIYLEIED